MKQVRAFDPSKGGNRLYFCLQNVRLGFSIPPLYDDAWTAWRNTEQHKNRSIPSGVDVPLYYSFTATIGGVRKNWGHINIRYRDGRIWNDGKWFSSLSAFEKAHTNISYVGWGESVNKVKVIEEKPVQIESQPPVFDVRYYRNRHKDLARNGVDTNAKATAHWLKHGIKEGRQSTAHFNVREYLANYGDLRRAFGINYLRAVRHYYTNGISEGRRGTRYVPTIVVDKSHEVIDKIINYAKGLK
jgi:hypothetical protein